MRPERGRTGRHYFESSPEDSKYYPAAKVGYIEGPVDGFAVIRCDVRGGRAARYHVKNEGQA